VILGGADHPPAAKNRSLGGLAVFCACERMKIFRVGFVTADDGGASGTATLCARRSQSTSMMDMYSQVRWLIQLDHFKPRGVLTVYSAGA
jgi:hypothetical protein